jgi:hypothetical protein
MINLLKIQVNQELIPFHCPTWWANRPLFCKTLYAGMGELPAEQSPSKIILRATGKWSDKYSSGISCNWAPWNLGMISYTMTTQNN